MVEVATANIVRDFNVGNTKIKIADDYCREKSPTDIEKILDRIAKTALSNFVATTNKTQI